MANYSQTLEFFADIPVCSCPGNSASPVRKTYKYGRVGDMEVTVHQNGDVGVYYAPSCLVFHVERGDAQAAWDFANERKQHLRMIGC